MVAIVPREIFQIILLLRGVAKSVCKICHFVCRFLSWFGNQYYLSHFSDIRYVFQVSKFYPCFTNTFLRSFLSISPDMWSYPGTFFRTMLSDKCFVFTFMLWQFLQKLIIIWLKSLFQMTSKRFCFLLIIFCSTSVSRSNRWTVHTWSSSKSNTSQKQHSSLWRTEYETRGKPGNSNND